MKEIAVFFFLAVLFAVASCDFGVAAQSAPFPPTSITATVPFGMSDHRGPNPVTIVEFEFEHDCPICDYEIYVDGADEWQQKLLPLDTGSTRQFRLFDVSVGEHVVEVRPTNGTPCPPSTVRPAGCSRYFAFTLLADGTLLIAPTNLRILPVDPPPL